MTKKVYAILAAAGVLFMAASVLPASAALGTYVNTSASANTNGTSMSVSASLDTSARAKADTAINNRITALNGLETRINQMVRISADEKTSLDASIQSSVSDMATLKAKIDADTDNATLKADIQSITKSYRIYLLVMPQGRIIAAGDRIMTIVGLFGDLSTKLQARISAAQTAGKDVTALNASLSDMNAKTADANVQAQAAITEVAALHPDNGDKTVFASNQAALKDARAKIKAAMADLKTARSDAGSIVKALIAMKLDASANATSNTSAQ